MRILRGMLLAGAVLLGPLPAWAQVQLAEADLDQLSIEQLANVEITSVSKAPQPLSSAAASIYVISHDDVIRSGAQSVPEMLRLAPNLEVMQTSPSAYQITARGFNGNSAAQNFPNKLLVLIDGRSVYTPLYSGVYWDVQDVLPENVERIEVISGPGGTLWGANAVNGVINIITRKASDTPGGVLTLGVGDQYASAALQYGGRLDDNIDYRVYARDFWQRAFNSAPGVGAHDGWAKPQGGFRVDWSQAQDLVTLSGDIYSGVEDQLGGGNQDIAGGNLTARWQRTLDDQSSLQLLAYYDETQRSAAGGGGAFVLNTYDIEAQHNFSIGSWNNIVWGVGERVHQYRITDRVGAANSLMWNPGSRTLNLANIFAEDHIPLSDSVQLTIGLKLEDDPYSGVSPMPSGRLAWQLSKTDMLWAAISRAVRSPTPFDTDVVEKLGTTTFLTGNINFMPETVTAYEAGYRGELFSSVNLSVTLFDDEYDDLRTIEPGPTVIPLLWGNLMQGSVHGVELWASYQALDWWRLSAGFSAQYEDLSFAAGASMLLGLAQAGNDPHHWASLRSSISLPYDMTFDTDFRYVGALPNPAVPEYVEANARLGWKVSDTLSLALSGYNLLHGQHVEYSPGDEIRRSVFLETRLRF
ncbi:MAG TPA: TonB-dependent receptor [Rhizomicrobium sp.]|nr:TonB-dependent receptor [Rhizomicrobium sp.]